MPSLERSRIAHKRLLDAANQLIIKRGRQLLAGDHWELKRILPPTLTIGSVYQWRNHAVSADHYHRLYIYDRTGRTALRDILATDPGDELVGNLEVADPACHIHLLYGMGKRAVYEQLDYEANEPPDRPAIMLLSSLSLSAQELWERVSIDGYLSPAQTEPLTRLLKDRQHGYI